MKGAERTMEYSAAEFRKLVVGLESGLYRGFVEAQTRAAEQVYEALGSVSFENYGNLIAARNAYTDAAWQTARHFYFVCHEVLALQEECDQDVDRALGLDGAPPRRIPVFSTVSVEDLSANVRMVAAEYAERSQALQERFLAARDVFVSDWEALLRDFENSLGLAVAEGPEGVPEGLNAALRQVQETGQVRRPDGLGDEAAAAAVVYAATVVEVGAATAALWTLSEVDPALPGAPSGI